MWNTSCSNRICFTQDRTYEQNLHLKRLFCVRPEINVTRPFSPKFLEIRAPQKEKRRQTQDKINKENDILTKKILEVYFKNGKYSKYVVKPKEIYPAFRRYSGLKFNDIIKLVKINNDNFRLENKLLNLKSTYDNEEMRKEAEKQEKYLNNLLNRPKSIPFTPALNFISIEQLHSRLKNQLIRQQQYLNEQQNINNENTGNNSKRRNSSHQLRNGTENNSKIDKINGESNKKGNKTNRSQRSQSSKKKKSLNLNGDMQIDNNKNNDDIDKKVKKETGTTKSNTGAKK